MRERSSQDERGHVFVIAAPSGTGKTTLCHRLLERDAGLRLSVSHTTREMRPGEVDGVDYHFVDHRRFRELVEAGAFLEHAEYNGNLYGTSWEAIEATIESGEDVVLEIEVQGAEQVKERRPSAHLIFLLPPSLTVLEQRLRGRGTDGEAVIQKRMALADRELAAARHFDYAVVNDDLECAVDEVLGLVRSIREGRDAEAHSRHGLVRVLEAWHRSNAG